MDTVTANHCAARWGISEASARRILATVPPIGRDTETGAMLYDPTEADAARDCRPGRGTRTDLAANVMPAGQYEALVTDETIPVQHRALWALLRDGYTRVTDALSLDIADVDFDQRVARVDFPKRRTDPRVIPVSERTAELLRQAKGDRDAGPLITGAHGRPLGRETASRFARHVGASIHAFRPVPHKVGEPPSYGVTQVPAGEVQVGDVVFLADGRSVNVTSVQTVDDPDGRPVMEINVINGFPFLLVAATEPVLIGTRQPGQ
ncbi:tyrosine-type recombinase/integrase [Streptomyces melanogenes]|uniref:tyrosine-type recombinase/integrase n=1 Tax=Streptomyces melanogenes TaxID=67326 RepID=UPI00379080FB